MSATAKSRVSVCLPLIFCLSSALSAQDQKAPLDLKSSPVITAATAGGKFRFSSPAGVAQIRVQIVSANGDLLFDSAWKDGNVLDWPIESPANGSYRCTVTVKGLDGQVTQKEAVITAQNGQVSLEQRADSEGLTVLGADETGPKITLLAHDGANGSVVSTSGDLSFRLGNFLAGKDSERMRLTSDGELHVDGLIRASKGIVFADGTILTTASGVASAGTTGSIVQQRASVLGSVNGPGGLQSRPSGTSNRLTPHPTFAPAFQFVLTDTGVNIGTTNPAYNLDVTGYVNTASQYNLGGTPFAYNLGTQNTFLGVLAGNFMMAGGTSNNTAIGYSALGSATTGGSNTAVGSGALNQNNTGSQNTATGWTALANLTTGSNNTAVGWSTSANMTGSGGTAVGALALNNDTGSGNTAIGLQALRFKSSGDNNVAIGSFAGNNISTGSSNIDIGNAGLFADTSTIRIGLVQTRAFIAGISGATTGNAAVPVVIDSNGQMGTVSSSSRYKFDVADMRNATDSLMRLRPVTFRYLAHGENAPLQYGLIAEEVAEVYPEMVARTQDGEVESVMYQFLAPMLLNEVQKQHREIEEQKKTIDSLKATRDVRQKTIDALSARLDALGERLEVLETQALHNR